MEAILNRRPAWDNHGLLVHDLMLMMEMLGSSGSAQGPLNPEVTLQAPERVVVGHRAHEGAQQSLTDQPV